MAGSISSTALCEAQRGSGKGYITSVICQAMLYACRTKNVGAELHTAECQATLKTVSLRTICRQLKITPAAGRYSLPHESSLFGK